MTALLNRALGLCTAVALVAMPLKSPAADPLEINVIFSLTGAIAFIGKESVSALAVAEDTINKGGGIGGRPIKFVIQDDQSNPQIAVQIAQSLLAKNVPVIFGPIPVASCNAVAPLIKDRTVMYCQSAAFHPAAHSYGYSAGISTIDQFIFGVRYLRLRGLKKIATITSTDSNGMDADRGVSLALGMPENKGVDLVAAEHFTIGDLTVAAQIAKIKASGAQAILTGNNGTPLGVILHGYTDSGLDSPLVTTPGALNVTTTTQFAAILPKEFLVTGVLSDGPEVIPNGPEKAAFLVYTSALKAAGIEPDHALSVNWDPVMIIVAAFRKYGPNATAAQINGYIESLHGWSGTAGRYDFRNGNQSGLNPNFLVMVRYNPVRKAWSAVSKPGGLPLANQ